MLNKGNEKRNTMKYARLPFSLRKTLAFVAIACLTLALPSCGSKRSALIDQAISRAEVRLGMPIGKHNYYPLYLEVADWLGTPYRNGGTTRRGVDCSGFVQAIVDAAYGEQISRTTRDQMARSGQRISRRNLREGDLVFFSSGRSKKTPTHVGIYLQDGLFAHASSSRGVCISSLDEGYWDENYLAAVRRK
jgi:lipoprotein Spr